MLDSRWEVLGASDACRQQLLEPLTLEQAAAYEHNIERFIGTVKVPVGIMGPLRVNGLFAEGDYYVPLAATEASLVASYSRGAQVISEVGGAHAMMLDEGLGRSPVFGFQNLLEVTEFVSWMRGNVDTIREVAEGTSRYCELLDLQVKIDGNNVYVLFLFSTGDASGQNMVTFATDAAVRWILESCPSSPRISYLEANFSGDKKASSQSFQGVRGRSVTAEVVLPADLVKQRLHTTPEQIAEYGKVGMLGSVLSGTLGAQAHYANGLAAMFIACGQDVACVSEAAIGTTRFDVTADSNLYASVSLPNLTVGTVGGGTKLPSQRACLQIMGLAGAGHARAFAEVAACVCLAGEISLVAAISAGQFAQAHARLARGKELP